MKQTAILVLGLFMAHVARAQGPARPPAAVLVVDSVRYEAVARSDDWQIVVPYRNGVSWGEARIEDASGRLQARFQVAQGVLVGTCATYDSEGRMRTSTSYGDYTPPTYAQYTMGWRAPHDTPAWPVCQRYFMGRMEGLRRSYDQHGRLTAEEMYAHGMRHGPSRIWWTVPGEDRLYLATAANYVEGKLDGPWVCFWPGGGVLLQSAYLGGQEHGMATLYDEAGRTTERWHSHLGRRDTTWTYFTVGSGLRRRTYVDSAVGGLREETYHPNGRLASQGTLYDGVHHGAYTSYDAEGRVVLRGTYDRGMKHGRWEFLDTDGTVRATETFDQGVIVITAVKGPATKHGTATEVYVFPDNEFAEVEPPPPPMDGGCAPEVMYLELLPQPRMVLPAALVPRGYDADRPLCGRMHVSPSGNVTEVVWPADLPAAQAAALTQAFQAKAWQPAALGRGRGAWVHFGLYRP